MAMNFVPLPVIHPQNWNVNKEPFTALGVPAHYKPQNLKSLWPVPTDSSQTLEAEGNAPHLQAGGSFPSAAAATRSPTSCPHAGYATRSEYKWENTKLALDGQRWMYPSAL